LRMADAFALTAKLLANDIVSCINLGLGGFDTHVNQSMNLEPTLRGFDFCLAKFIDQLKAANAFDNTLIVVYSDFGRTPRINNSNGRDHWPVGGALMIGGNLDGGRVVGATNDDTLLALNVNPTTGNASSG